MLDLYGYILTRTVDPSILRRSTVVNSLLLCPTIQQSALISHASYIVKNYPTVSCTKVSPSRCSCKAWMQETHTHTHTHTHTNKGSLYVFQPFLQGGKREFITHCIIYHCCCSQVDCILLWHLGCPSCRRRQCPSIHGYTLPLAPRRWCSLPSDGRLLWYSCEGHLLIRIILLSVLKLTTSYTNRYTLT